MLSLLPPTRLLVWLRRTLDTRQAKGEAIPSEFTDWLTLVGDPCQVDAALLDMTIQQIDVTAYVGRDVSPAVLCALQWLVERRYGEAWVLHATPLDDSDLWRITKIEAHEVKAGKP